MRIYLKENGIDPFLLSNLMSMSAQKIQNLNKSIVKPYFSRLDFREYGKDKESIYIGKVGVIDLDGNVIVTDWRAPVATLYYDSNLGPVFYEAPIGMIKGELTLKRQIMIENGALKDIFDVDAVSDDELLRPYLGANADNRLKNIVASIQSEQNEIIRETLYKNCIIQGVAGSGKTTVALHRIAYLVYTYRDNVSADNFLVIGPNEFFINYISTVLPDLDVGNAKQLTFEKLAKEFVSENFEIINPTKKLVDIINGKTITKDLRYKMSMKFKTAIDNSYKDIKKYVLPNKDFKINGFKVLELNEILSEYEKDETLGKSISSSIDTTIQRLENKIKNSYDIYNNLKEYYDKILKDMPRESKKYNLKVKEYFNINKLLEHGCGKELKRYFNINRIKVIDIYKMFVNDIEKYVDKNNELENMEGFKEETLKLLKNKKVEFEDLPALMYIKYLIFGAMDYIRYAHAVIDEAQDFGTFNFYVLKIILSKSTFSIFGDLTQAIYAYRGIKNWDEVRWECFNNKADILYLEKSYRTTTEIMEEANNISEHLGLGRGVPVIRHGEEVRYVEISNNNKVKYIVDKIKESKDKGYTSIAVICKTQKEAESMYNELHNSIEEDVTLIDDDNKEYTGGICVLTSYLSKGLEFDLVIIENVNEKEYNSNNDTDMKLLYVAMTRGLHELELMYDTNIIKLLKK